MNPKRMHVLEIVILMALPSMARAQSDSDDIAATVTVMAAVDVVGIADLDFGAVLQSSGEVRSSDIPTVGEWSVGSLPNPGGYQVTFTLPAALDNGLWDLIPITFGSESGVIRQDGGAPGVFDPAFPVASGGHNSLQITLGEDVPFFQVKVGEQAYQYEKSYPIKGHSATLPKYAREVMAAGRKPLIIERPTRFLVYLDV